MSRRWSSVTVAGSTYAAINNGNGTWTLLQNTISPRLQAGLYDVVVRAAVRREMSAATRP